MELTSICFQRLLLPMINSIMICHRWSTYSRCIKNQNERRYNIIRYSCQIEINYEIIFCNDIQHHIRVHSGSWQCREEKIEPTRDWKQLRFFLGDDPSKKKKIEEVISIELQYVNSKINRHTRSFPPLSTIDNNKKRITSSGLEKIRPRTLQCWSRRSRECDSTEIMSHSWWDMFWLSRSVGRKGDDVNSSYHSLLNTMILR